MKSYERCARAMAAVLLGFFVLLIAELMEMSLDADKIHTQEKKTECTEWNTEGAKEEANTERIEKKHAENREEMTYQTIYVRQVQESYHSAPRIIRQELIQKPLLQVNDGELEILYRIVQAEAGGEDDLGKKMVANVIINRVKDDRFPDTLEEVVFQKSGGKVQFSPTADGRYEKVTVTKETREAVDEALLEKDHTNGALYFVASAKTSSDKMSWFENHLICKGTHGGHTFYQ